MKDLDTGKGSHRSQDMDCLYWGDTPVSPRGDSVGFSDCFWAWMFSELDFASFYSEAPPAVRCLLLLLLPWLSAMSSPQYSQAVWGHLLPWVVSVRKDKNYILGQLLPKSALDDLLFFLLPGLGTISHFQPASLAGEWNLASERNGVSFLSSVALLGLVHPWGYASSHFWGSYKGNMVWILLLSLRWEGSGASHASILPTSFGCSFHSSVMWAFPLLRLEVFLSIASWFKSSLKLLQIFFYLSC